MITQSRNTIAVPPGETIREQLEEIGMSQREFALRMGFTEKHISRLVNGLVSLTPETAIKLESVLGMPASFWCGLEAGYRTDLARANEENSMEEEEAIARKSPYNACVKLGWLPAAATAAEKVRNMRTFFGVSNLRFILDPEKKLLPKVAYRCLDDKECHDMARAIWVRKAIQVAENIHVQPLNLFRLEQMVQDFRSMTVEHPSVFYPKMQEMCASCGVALIVIDDVSGSGLHGASFSVGPKVILALTVRRGWADVFWFSFFHELFHVLEMHFSQEEVDTDQQNTDADTFSCDTLIPPSEYARLSFVPLVAEDIRIFAKSIGIAPGIVVGRLQKEGRIEYDRMSQLKDRYKLC